MSPLSRRAFLSTLGRAGAASAALAAFPYWAHDALAQDGAEIVVRNEWPEHWETSLEALGRAFRTPNDVFFVRSHHPVPELPAANHRIEIAGRVRKPFSIAAGELKRFHEVSRTYTLECAGNGRGLFALPSTSGTQWEQGAVGNATWTGVKLSAVLVSAGMQPEARHVWFECADHGLLPKVPPFTRSIPLAKAMDDVILATGMNGAPLPRLHGGPVRAVVPGWFGMAWAKWVTRIRLEPEPSDNHFMVKGYRYTYPGVSVLDPVETMRVKSVITRPLTGARVGVGKIQVRGLAWSGLDAVKSVEISADGGRTWQPARLTGESFPRAWRTWAAEVAIGAAGHYAIMARATDAAGKVQSAVARANAAGYANNSIHKVTIDARA